MFRYQGEAAVGSLGGYRTLLEWNEPRPRATREGVAIQELSARMVLGGAGPLNPPLTLQPLVIDSPDDGSQAGHLVEDLRGVVIGKLVFQVQSQLAAQAPAQVGDDLPVGTAFASGGHGPPYPLHPAFAVGESAVLLGETGGGQDHVGDLRGLVHEYVLYHQELQAFEQLLRVVQVGLRE